jgi:Ca2+-binding RTX toxin-like protein
MGYHATVPGFLYGVTDSLDVTVYGTTNIDTINLTFLSRSSSNPLTFNRYYNGNFTFITGAGDDWIRNALLQNGDSVDMGAGDDKVNIIINTSYGTPTLANLSLVKLDGGAGSDTLSFNDYDTQDSSSTPQWTSLTLTTGGATNFENITGSSVSETIEGDTHANKLEGKGGNDTLLGYAGNDTLKGDGGNDSGGNTSGDDILDGGTGTDTLTGGGGNDVFVIRLGDGSSELVDTNIITDFEDDGDLINLDNGLNYSELNIEQGTDSYASHTIISLDSDSHTKTMADMLIPMEHYPSTAEKQVLQTIIDSTTATANEKLLPRRL